MEYSIQRSWLWMLTATLLLTTASRGSELTPVMFKGHPAHPTRILAKVATGSTVADHATAFAVNRLTAVRDFELVPGLVLLEVDTPVVAMSVTHADGGASADEQAFALQQKIESLRRSGLFEYVEPDFLVSPDRTPSDSSFTNGTLWGLRNTGQSGGSAGVDIDAVRAWDVTTGSSNVIVAVLDSGIHTSHLDLSARVWRNPGEIAGNGRDDDGNGYVDDVFGIDAANRTGNVADTDGHGTHVAGTIGAAANNGQPHVGVAWDVRLMACKMFADSSDGFVSAAITGLDYAADHGAKVVNCSWGLSFRSQALGNAINAAGARGVLVVAAAGNDSTNNDYTPHYPSDYEYDNVISVAAIDRHGERAGFSNFGVKSVDLGAPGVDIHSTVHTSNTEYRNASGTSMAAPHVAGVAALVRSAFPGISVWDLRDRLLRTTTAMTALQGLTSSGGRVNAYQALTQVGDGQLELSVTPATGETLFHGRETLIRARVTDLVGVTGATVNATMSTGGTLALRDDGVAPDLAANDANYVATLSVPTSGTELSLTVDASAPGKNGTSVNFTHYLQSPPANDHFADRATLAFNHGTFYANNFGATIEPGEPKIAGELGGASLWWTWTAPADTTVTIDTVGSNFDTLLGVYTGNNMNVLAEIVSNDDIDGPNQPSKVTFDAIAGTVYQIAVDGWEGKAGSITLNLTTTIRPPNDNFADRIMLTGDSFSTSGSHLNATREAGEPSHFSGDSESGSVWFTWTAPATGTATLRTASTGDSYPWNVLAVYVGSSLADLVRVPGRADDSQHTSWARTTFGAMAGTTYQIAVAFNAQAGDFLLTLSAEDSPANDHFANRSQIAGTTITTTASNVGATRELGEPQHFTDALGASVWWTWTAPADGTAVLTTGGSSAQTVLAVYTGSSLESLNLVAANDYALPGGYAGGSRVAFFAVAGTAYQIAIDSAGWVSSVNLNIALVDPPVNDRFADRTTVTGAPATLMGTLVGATVEAGEPAAGEYSSLGTSVWFSWTAPTTGTARVVGNDYPRPLVSVYTGSSTTELAAVTNSATQDTGSQVIFRATAGTSYQIRVDAGSLQAEGPFVLELSLVNAPANDMFADRATLTGTSATVTGTTVDATIEAGEPYHGSSSYGGASVWWTWTAPADGSVFLEAIGISGNAAELAVYSGSSLASLVRVSNLIDGWIGRASYMFSATGGTTYHFAVATYYGSVATFTLSLEHITPPANDLFANRTVLAGSTIDMTANTRGATRESGEPYFSSHLIATVWLQWTAPADGTAVITSGETHNNMEVGVYTGTTLSSLTIVASTDYWSPSESVAFKATAGTTYQIVVGSRFEAMGDVPLTLSLLDPPENDLFADATVIAGDAILASGSNAGALRESGEPAHRYDYNSNNGSIWWRWTPSASGIAVISTDGSAIATDVSVYIGTSLTSLSQIADGTGESSARGRLVFNVSAGTTYWIAVQGQGGARGPIALRLTRYVPPANDSFADRTVLSGGAVEVSGYNYGATAESGEPDLAGYYNSNSVWWTWTAPANGRAVLIVTSTEMGPLVGAFTGSTFADLSTVKHSGNSDIRVVRTVFDATAGTTYHIAVASRQSTYGSFDLSLSLVDPPPNDDFVNRALITGGTATVTGHNVGAMSEPGEGYHGNQYPAATVWWTWMAPSGGPVAVSTLASDIDALVTIHTGSSVSNLGTVIGAQGRVVFNGVAGTTYQIVVDGVNGDMGAIALDLVQGEYAYGWVGTDSADFAAGSAITLSANVTEGTGPFTYQWLYNGAPIEGATSSTLAIPSVQRFHSTGGFRVRVSNAFGTHESGSYWPIVQAPSSSNARLLNLSTRALGFSGEDALIPGFVISGTGTRRVLLRAVGPQLTEYGVAGAMTDPQMVLKRLVGEPPEIIATNNDWGVNANAADIAAAADLAGAFPLTDGSKDAALLLDLEPGQYTVTADDAAGEPGVAIVELYDAATDSSSSSARLVNLSNRGYVGTGADVMIPGFVVSSEGAKTILLRAVGPQLEAFGVTSVLEDPKLVVYRKNPDTGANEQILSNDNWGENNDVADITATAAQVGAFPLDPGSRDAAFVITLPPGVYTVHASGADGGTGVALVEVYVVD